MAKKTTVIVEKQRRSHSAAGLLIPAGLFIGMGVGMLINQVAVGMFIGLGMGFLCFAIALAMKK